MTLRTSFKQAYYSILIKKHHNYIPILKTMNQANLKEKLHSIRIINGVPRVFTPTGEEIQQIEVLQINPSSGGITSVDLRIKVNLVDSVNPEVNKGSGIFVTEKEITGQLRSRAIAHRQVV